MKKEHFYIVFIILWGTYYTTNCQNLSFFNYDEKNGLPQSHVLSLLEDSQGFIWIGLTDGLCRFDGKEFREFRAQKGDSTSLSNNFVKDILEDSNGHIWIATRNGLNRYFPESETFERINNQEGLVKDAANYIHDIIEDQFGKIWFATYDGLFRLDPNTKDIIRFAPEEENEYSLPSKTIWNLFEDSKNRIWIGTTNGLSLYQNDNQFQFQNILPEPTKNGLKTRQVWRFGEQPDGTIWVGTDQGLYRVVENDGIIRFRNLELDLPEGVELTNNFIEDFIIDGNDKLWVGCWRGGLNELILPGDSKEEITINHYEYEVNNPQSLPLNLVESLLKDQSGNLWVGTGGGLAKWNANGKKINLINKQADQELSLSDNVVKTFFQDSYGNYWFGARSGLNRLSKDKFDKRIFEFEVFKKEPGNDQSLAHNNTFYITEDGQKRLWVATYGGLSWIDLNSFDNRPVFNRLTMDDGLPHNFIYHLLEINPNEYLVATAGQLSKMTWDQGKVSFQNFDMDEEREDALVNATTYHIAKDKNGDAWIATFNGLSKYIEKDGRIFFENYLHDPLDSTSLSNNSVLVLFLDSKGNFWIGTRDGLNLMIQKEGERAEFKLFDESDGLSNKIIQSIEEDEEGHLWIGTNRGLNQFDIEAALKGEKPVLKIYDFRDGLSGNLCMSRAAYKDHDGNLFFGFGGINYFKPENIQENQNPPEIVFTKLKLFNEEVKPEEGKEHILNKSIAQTEEIILDYKQNMLTFEFAALDFTEPLKNQYAYLLEGFKDEWIQLGNQNFATFTSLAPGTYNLKVKGSNNDGLWGRAKRIKIKVLPPPWKTWWAYVLYAMLLLGVFYSFYKYRINEKIKALKQQQEVEVARLEERENLRKKNAADFHDDLGHRLTKISLFLELAERQTAADHPVFEFLSKIKLNAIGLSAGIRDLIWTLDPQKDTLYQTMIRLQEFGDQLFEYSDIQFQTKGISLQLDKIQLEPDVRKQVLLIFKEVMNNALKYSKASQTQLELKRENDSLNLYFKDDGAGFDLNEISRGYGLKNIKDRASKIGCDLKIQTTVGDGVRIELIKIPHVG